MSATLAPSPRPTAGAIGAVLLVSVAVCWVNLGGAPLNRTEGHRAIPGWEMLASGEPFPTRLFGTVYINKPPGMPWAVACVSLVLGETALAARAVSALAITLLALLAAWFGARWFGAGGSSPDGDRRAGPRTAGIAGGCAVLMMPVMWATARSADIEGPLCLAAGLMAFSAIDVLVAGGGRSRGRRAMLGACCGLGVVGAALLKGPAIAPTLAGVLIGAWVGTGSLRVLASRWLWIVLGVSGAAVAGLAAWMLALVPEDEPVVRQSVSGFLWTPEQLDEIAAYVPGALALAGPVALALLFPWGRDARDEAVEPEAQRRWRVARALAGGCLGGLLVGTVAGLSNPRYGLPTLVVGAPAAAYVVVGLGSGLGGGLGPGRRRIARAMLLGRAWAWPVLLCVVAVIWSIWVRPRGRDAGRNAGEALSELIAEDAVLWADTVAYDTPEVVWYGVAEARARGVEIDARWARAEIPRRVLPPPGGHLLLTTGELRRYARAGHLDRLVELGRVPAATYRARPDPGGNDYILLRVPE